MEAFHRGLRDDGYVEGRDVAIEFLFAVKTTKVLGLTIPEPFLLRADEVIE